MITPESALVVLDVYALMLDLWFTQNRKPGPLSTLELMAWERRKRAALARLSAWTGSRLIRSRQCGWSLSKRGHSARRTAFGA